MDLPLITNPNLNRYECIACCMKAIGGAGEVQRLAILPPATNERMVRMNWAEAFMIVGAMFGLCLALWIFMKNT